jgi:hypothetical protein
MPVPHPFVIFLAKAWEATNLNKSRSLRRDRPHFSVPNRQEIDASTHETILSFVLLTPMILPL